MPCHSHSVRLPLQHGTIDDILNFRLRDFPSTMSSGARQFVLAAMTHDARHRPGPKALLAHPWVTAYVNSVASLLSSHNCLTTDEIAAQVVAVTGSVGGGVSMLHSMRCMQV
jgi:serine/threonine protein kinase